MPSVAALLHRYPSSLGGSLQILCILISSIGWYPAWREATALFAVFIPVLPRNLSAVVILAITTGHLHFHRNRGSAMECAATIVADEGHLLLPPTLARLDEIHPLGKAWVSVATLLDAATIRTRTIRLDLPRGSMIAVRGRTKPPQAWSTILLSGPASLPETSRNPGEWDARARLLEKGIRMEMHLNHLEPRPDPPQPPLGSRINRALAETVQPTEIHDDEALQLIRSSLLGVSGDSLGSVINDFRDTGTLHLFAVSGMNIAVLAVIVRMLTRPFGTHHPSSTILAAAAMTIYAVGTGLAPSCQRALSMALIPLAAHRLNRPTTLIDLLSASVVILLLVNPNLLSNTGFQLSVALVLGLATLSPFLADRFGPKPRNQLIPEHLLTFRQKTVRATLQTVAASIAVSLTATVVSLPWSFIVFRQLPLHAPLINLAAVPIANLQLVGAFTAILTAPIPSVSRRVTDMNLHVARLLIQVVRLGARWPTTILIPTASTSGADFILLDEPGSCVSLLGPPDHTTLINVGSESLFRSSVSRALQAHGCRAPEVVMLTTGDSLHLGGAIPLLERSPPMWWATPATSDRSTHHRQLREWMEARQIAKRFLLSPRTFPLQDGSSIRCLHPDPGFNAARAADNSAVLQWEKKGARVLFSGPAGFPTEQVLSHLAVDDIRSDIWFKGLHPRDISGSATLLERIDPQVVILNRNPYRGSDPSVASIRSHCAARGTTLLEMAHTGAIIGRFTEEGIHLTPHMDPDHPMVIRHKPQRLGRK